MRRRTILAAPLAALAVTTAAKPSFAQSYPDRPVRIIVPYPAGQGSDIFARRFAEFFRQHFDRPFVIENRPGAGGNIGAVAAARSEPDGYTLLWGTNATHAANEFLFASLGFDPVRDFAPVAGILRLGMVLSVSKGAPYATLADFLAAARARPGRISVGVPSTTARAVLAMLRQTAKVELLEVPYSGSGQGLTGLLRGDVQATMDTVTASLGPIRSEQIVPLAVSLARRSESLPDTPTFRESTVDFAADAWNALYAPSGAPAAIVAALNAAANTALSEPTLRATLVRDGAEPMGGPPEALAELMRTDRAKWGPAIRSLGLTPQ